MFDGSGGNVFLNLLGAAMLDWIRAAASIPPLGCAAQRAAKRRNIVASGKRAARRPWIRKKYFRALKGRDRSTDSIATQNDGGG